MLWLFLGHCSTLCTVALKEGETEAYEGETACLRSHRACTSVHKCIIHLVSQHQVTSLSAVVFKLTRQQSKSPAFLPVWHFLVTSLLFIATPISWSLSRFRPLPKFWFIQLPPYQFPCHQCLWHPSNETTVCLIFLACHVASSCSSRTVLMGSQCVVREGASSSTPRSPGCDISAGPHSQGVHACYLIYTPANLHKSVWR